MRPDVLSLFRLFDIPDVGQIHWPFLRILPDMTLTRVALHLHPLDRAPSAFAYLRLYQLWEQCSRDRLV